MKKLNVVLSVAGSDSGAGAGIQADMKSVAACGGYCTTAITAVTAQNTTGVKGVEIVSDAMIRAQIEAVMQDFNVTALKLGMLPSVGCVDIVAATILKYNIKNVVLDPVMVATSGDMLVSDEVARHIAERLMPLCRVVTPNIPESEFIASVSIKSEDDFMGLKSVFNSFGCGAVLLKAGHLEGRVLTDYLFDFETNIDTKFSFERVDTPNTHGTGCSLSSSIAAYLSQGNSLVDSVALAEDFLHTAIQKANYKLGQGHGPINHLYAL